MWLGTVQPYFEAGRYRRRSPRETARASIAYTLGFVSFVLVLTILTAETATDPDTWPIAVPMAVVVGKSLIELLLRRTPAPFEFVEDPFTHRQSWGTLRSSRWQIAQLPAVEQPTTPPRTVVQPSRWRLLVTSPIVGAVTPLGGRFLGLFLGLGVAVFAFGGSERISLLLCAIGVTSAVLFGLPAVMINQVPIEYQFYDDQLVCYDQWLGAAQWRLRYANVEQVRVVQTVTDRLGSTATLIIETTDDHPARIRSVRQYEAVGELLDPETRPVDSDRLADALVSRLET